jgi:hypothetical protein
MIARFPGSGSGNGRGMATIEVHPRNTPAERADTNVEIEIDEDLTVFAEIMEDWVAPLDMWELQLREGHDFGRVNNVEARLLYVMGEQTSVLAFRLDQLDAVTDTGEALVMRFEERDGIAKMATATVAGLEIELFHILTIT